MSYNSKNMSSNDFNPIFGLGKIFKYTSFDDSQADVLVSGYFNPTGNEINDLAATLAVGDSIIVRATDGNEIIYVTELNPTTTSAIGSAGGGGGFQYLIYSEEDLIEALSHNKTNLAILGDFTLTQNIVFPEASYYIFSDSVVTSENFTFDVNSEGNTNFNFYGPNQNTAGFVRNPTSSHAFFINDSGSNVYYFENISLINNSTLSNTPASENATVKGLFSAFSSAGDETVVNNCINLNTVDSELNNCLIIGSAEIRENLAILNGCSIGPFNLSVKNANNATIVNCNFQNSSLTLEGSSSQTIITGCSTLGSFTFTDTNENSIRAGNSAEIGNSYTTANSGTHNTNWSGIWAAPQVGNIKYEVVNNVVFLTLPQVLATKNAAGFISSTVTLPAPLIPDSDRFDILTASDDAITTAGAVIVGGTGGVVGPGTIIIYRTVAQESFGSAILSGGFLPTTIKYGLS